MQWSSKSIASRLHHEFFYFLVRCRLLFLAHISLYFVVLYYSIMPSIRKRAYPYLTKRFPNAKGLTLWLHCFRAYHSFGTCLLARSIAGILNKDCMAPSEKEKKTLLHTIPHDSGCIILTGHIGIWQLGLAGIEKSGKAINIVQWLNPEDVDKHYFAHKGQDDKHTIRIINPQDPLNASLEIIAALRRHEIVCMAGDRIFDSASPSVDVSFLGQKILLPTTPYLFASMAQVPLVIAFSVFTNGAVHGIKAERVAIPSGLRRNPIKLQELAQYFASTIEDITDTYPYHFFNFYDMWDIHDKSRM